MMARQHSCVPVLVDSNQVLMASPNPLDPNVEEELRLRFGMSVRSVLCTPANISDVIAKYVPRDASIVEAAPLAPVQATGAAAAPQAAAPTAAARPKRSGPLTPEEMKERRDYSLVAFNLSVMILMGILWQFLGKGFWASAMVALPVAAVAAGVTWKLKSR